MWASVVVLRGGKRCAKGGPDAVWDVPVVVKVGCAPNLAEMQHDVKSRIIRMQIHAVVSEVQTLILQWQVWIYCTWATVGLTLMSLVRSYAAIHPARLQSQNMSSNLITCKAITTHTPCALLPIAQALTFKFWPDMSKEKSWERRVRAIALLCCCSRRVSQKSAEDGGSTPLARMALVFASVGALAQQFVAQLSFDRHDMLHNVQHLALLICKILFRHTADVWVCGHDDFRLPGGVPARRAAAAVPPHDRFAGSS